jgi:hypothetical protein
VAGQDRGALQPVGQHVPGPGHIFGQRGERQLHRDHVVAPLRYLDLIGRPVATRRELRLMAWLHRRHLSWLLLSWSPARIAWWFFLSGQRRAAVASEDRAIDLYCQASGVDRQGAGDEVCRLVGQLGPLVDRPEFVGLEQTAEPLGANRAELEAAADALLAYALCRPADRR